MNNNERITDYKNICYRFHRKFQILELLLRKENISDSQQFIDTLNQLVEIAEYTQPSVIIIEHFVADFNVSENVVNFTRQNIIPILRKTGTEKLLVVTEENTCADFFKPQNGDSLLIKIFKNKQEALDFVKCVLN